MSQNNVLWDIAALIMVWFLDIFEIYVTLPINEHQYILKIVFLEGHPVYEPERGVSAPNPIIGRSWDLSPGRAGQPRNLSPGRDGQTSSGQSNPF